MAAVSWTRLTAVLFVAMLGAMIWWQSSFARDQAQGAMLQAQHERAKALDATAGALAEELSALQSRLAETRRAKNQAAVQIESAQTDVARLEAEVAQAAVNVRAATEAAAAARAKAAEEEAAATKAKAETEAAAADAAAAKVKAGEAAAKAKAVAGGQSPALGGDIRAPPAPYSPRPATAGAFDAEEGYDFKDTAIFTMAAGNSAARGVIALLQSLRDVGTRVQDVVVMLSRGGSGSPECLDGAWKRANGREGIQCAGPATIAEEIISPQYLATMGKLGATIMVVPEIPSTPYTEGIPGGRSTFWGMALNKLRVFNMTQYKKLLWMDGDTMVLKNVDHLFKHPFGTMALTYACCNPNGPAIPSGGLWVVEPSLEVGLRMWRMMVEGKPKLNKGSDTGSFALKPDGSREVEYWHWGDMQILRWYMSKWALNPERETLWPRVDDVRHGAVPGQRFTPQFAKATEEEFKSKALGDRWNGKPIWDGFDPSIPANQVMGENMMGEQAPMWRSLDIRYDQCAASCECLPERDMPNEFFSIHFSCTQNGNNKPQHYETETALANALVKNALSCTRYYYWEKWYDAFKRAHGPLPDPFSGTVPMWDTSHDEAVLANRKKLVR